MTQQPETVAQIFAEIVEQAVGGQGGIPGPIKTMIRPYIGKATEAMTRNPEGTRDLLLAWVPRLCRAAEISPDLIRTILEAEDAVAARPTID